jgi:Kdo2-lipid IVA lauroyltransferase/acyltransferase
VARGELRPGPSTSSRRERLRARAGEVLLGLLGRLPARTALRLAAGFGRVWVRLGGPRTRIGLLNLRIAFPEWSEARRRRVLAESMANLARSIVEFAELVRLGPAALRERVRVEGLEHLEVARAASPSGGVIVLTAHFGSWELLAAAMSAYEFPVTVVHRTRNDPLLDRLVMERRAAGGAQLLARGSAARAALEALRDGRCLAMPYDQNCGREEGVFVPFFGRLACARDAPARIALRTGASVLPVFLHREPDGFHHVARVHPPLSIGSSGLDRRDAAAQAARAMTAAIEAAVREAPSEWIWIHRRWRTQPAGEPHPYPSRRRPAGATLELAS